MNGRVLTYDFGISCQPVRDLVGGPCSIRGCVFHGNGFLIRDTWQGTQRVSILCPYHVFCTILPFSIEHAEADGLLARFSEHFKRDLSPLVRKSKREIDERDCYMKVWVVGLFRSEKKSVMAWDFVGVFTSEENAATACRRQKHFYFAVEMNTTGNALEQIYPKQAHTATAKKVA